MKKFRRLAASMLLLACLLACPQAVQAQEYQRLTNLPALYITTFDGASIASKTDYVYCTLVLVGEDDTSVRYDSVQIRGRGNSTWNLSKKPYKIKFPAKQKFLGKGYAKAKKWTLLANAGDKTLIRNALTSEMGQWLGLPFNPAARFVDLTLNGEYLGNYQISDQVEVRKHRVRIAEQDLPPADTSDITGGYLLEADGFYDGNYFLTSQKSVPVRIHYPDEDIATEQQAYITNYVNAFEAALFSDSFDDPDRGYRPYVDSVSLAQWYIATEVSANIDGFFSTYFYKERQDPRLYWGPLWDYDIAYANDYRKGDTTQKLMAEDGYGSEAVKMWVEQMWNDPWFARLVNRNYAAALDNGLVDFLLQKVDSLNDLLQQSQDLNYEKWGINKRMYHEIVLYSSYDQYIADLKEFIQQHTDYLLSAFAQKAPQTPTPPFAPDACYYRISNAGTATLFDLNAPSADGFTDENPPAAGTLVCAWESGSRLSQDWQITPVGDYFFIQNRLVQLALADPTTDPSSATENVGTQLVLAAPDSTDDRQLWTITPQGTAGYFNLTNLHTQHTANLSSGSSSNGTAILSYTTDERNATSQNRLWYITATATPLPDQPDAIQSVPEPDDYALAYNPQTQTLHFAAADPAQLRFAAALYDLRGTLIRQFQAADPQVVADLPRGIYIVAWTAGGKRRSAKFQK